MRQSSQVRTARIVTQPHPRPAPKLRRTRLRVPPPTAGARAGARGRRRRTPPETRPPSWAWRTLYVLYSSCFLGRLSAASSPEELRDLARGFPTATFTALPLIFALALAWRIRSVRRCCGPISSGCGLANYDPLYNIERIVFIPILLAGLTSHAHGVGRQLRRRVHYSGRSGGGLHARPLPRGDPLHDARRPVGAHGGHRLHPRHRLPWLLPATQLVTFSRLPHHAPPRAVVRRPLPLRLSARRLRARHADRARAHRHSAGVVVLFPGRPARVRLRRLTRRRVWTSAPSAARRRPVRRRPAAAGRRHACRRRAGVAHGRPPRRRRARAPPADDAERPPPCGPSPRPHRRAPPGRARLVRAVHARPRHLAKCSCDLARARRSRTPCPGVGVHTGRSRERVRRVQRDASPTSPPVRTSAPAGRRVDATDAAAPRRRAPSWMRPRAAWTTMLVPTAPASRTSRAVSSCACSAASPRTTSPVTQRGQWGRPGRRRSPATHVLRRVRRSHVGGHLRDGATCPPHSRHRRPRGTARRVDGNHEDRRAPPCCCAGRRAERPSPWQRHHNVRARARVWPAAAARRRAPSDRGRTSARVRQARPPLSATCPCARPGASLSASPP